MAEGREPCTQEPSIWLPEQTPPGLGVVDVAGTTVIDSGVEDGGADDGGSEVEGRAEDDGVVEVLLAVGSSDVVEPAKEVTVVAGSVEAAVGGGCDEIPLERRVEPAEGELGSIEEVAEDESEPIVIEEARPDVLEVGDCTEVELVGRAHDPCLLRRSNTSRFLVCVTSHENENVYSQANALST